MTKQEIINYYYPFALASEQETGIPAIVQLAQGVIESGWFKICPGNMIFGIKDTDGINGNEQLITTTEYSRSANAKFPNIIKITPIYRFGYKWFKYTIKDYFRKYPSPKESFIDHCNFFLKNKRYARALSVKHDAYLFIDEIAKAGYATDPDYATKLKSIAKTIEKLIQKN